MKRWLALTALIMSLNSYSQTMKIDLWPEGKIPLQIKNNIKEVWEDLDIIRIAKVQVPQLEVYLPNKRIATGQAVIICPGGGYARLAYDWEGTDIAKLLNAHGIAAFVLKYRLPDSLSATHPEQVPLLDAQQAMRLVRSNAKQYNIQPNHIGIMGFSAGGHLAATLSTSFVDDDTRPSFSILIYPVISMDKAITHTGSRLNLIGSNPNEELVKKYSNELQVTDKTPPTFLLHATDDGAVPVENSLRYYQTLKDHKIPVELHIYPTGGHGFGLAIGKGALEKWPNLLIDWIALQK
jgi:acetyl esterase/lipase